MAGHQHTDDQPLDVFVSLREAAHAYDTTTSLLRARVRSAGLRAYKVPGPHGREWRVSLRSLESAGFAPRVSAPTSGEARPRVLELESELAVVRRRLVAEQRRAERADQQLGHAMLEVGRLRSALTRAAQGS